MNRILMYIPHLLAISASSPFWQKNNTGLMSYRSKIFEGLPTAGLPFYFKNWKEYEILVDNFITTKTIETIREIWWDVRPHPDFGTLEVRVCDVPPSLKETAAIAGLTQALIAKLAEDFEEKRETTLPHLSVVRQNKWRAARYGLKGELIDPVNHRTVKTEKAISDLLEELAPTADRLGSTDSLDVISNTLDNGSGAERQLKVYEETGDLKEVVKYLIGELNPE